MNIYPTYFSGEYYLTRDGSKVEIYKVVGTSKGYIYGAVLQNGAWDSVVWQKDGTFNSSGNHRLDIIGIYTPICPVILSISPKCECGHEKAKMPGHSPYCPKYEKL